MPEKTPGSAESQEPKPKTIAEFCSLVKTLNGKKFKTGKNQEIEFVFFQDALKPEYEELVDTETKEEFSPVAVACLTHSEFNIEINGYVRKMTLYEWCNDGRMIKSYYFENDPEGIEYAEKAERETKGMTEKQELEYHMHMHKGVMEAKKSDIKAFADFLSRQKVLDRLTKEEEIQHPLTDENLNSLNSLLKSLANK